MASKEFVPPSASILNRFPWLLEKNSWCMEVIGGQPASPHDRGVWPLGNGMVFAHAGLGAPVNRLQGMVGPIYQTEGDHSVDGAFGDCWWELEQNDEPLHFEREYIYRPRDSGVVVVISRSSSYTLATIDFAPPDTAVIVRIAELWIEDPGMEEVVINFNAPKLTSWPDKTLMGVTYRQGQALVAGIKLGSGRFQDESIRFSVSPFDRQFVHTFTVVLAAAEDISGAIHLFEGVRDPLLLLEENQEWWRSWLARTKNPALDALDYSARIRTADLLETVKVHLKMQQCRVSGAVSPMVHFKGVWARDSNGPVRAFLAMGCMDDARSILEYYYRASIVANRIANAHPLDLPVHVIDEGLDWEEVLVEPSEAASHLVLQHRWWVEAGGDLDLVERHWDYLCRSVNAQEQDVNGLLKFNGDETYLLGSLYSVLDGRVVMPHDLIDFLGHEDDLWSLEASVLLVAALEAMAWMSPKVGRGAEAGEFQARADKLREVVENTFWQEELGFYAPAVNRSDRVGHPVPFAPINLSPIYVGYHAPDSERARANVEKTLELVGPTGVTPGCGYNVGTTPAYLLSGLVSISSHRAHDAFDSLLSMASPGGEWAEVYAPGGRPTGGYSESHPNRLRPWEGGLAMDAIYKYFASQA